jgi:hypothetical protein
MCMFVYVCVCVCVFVLLNAGVVSFCWKEIQRPEGHGSPKVLNSKRPGGVGG